jgi:DinB superfamily
MHDLDVSLALLDRTPAALNAFLRDLPDAWTRRNEGEKTWSAFDVVGHLVHCEREDWMPRVRAILDHGDSAPFPPFDRFGHIRAVEGKSMAQVLDELIELRAKNLAELRSKRLTESDLALHGIHPGLGPVTLSELLATWAAHDLNHLHQMARVMAHQYRDVVGPFRQYLGVMHCNAHGG